MIRLVRAGANALYRISVRESWKVNNITRASVVSGWHLYNHPDPQRGRNWDRPPQRPGSAKALFFPIIDSEWDNAVPPGTPPTDYITAELRALAAATVDAATGLACEIDGVSVKGLANVLTTPYRAVSPVFDYTLPLTDNVDQFFGLNITGTVTGAVADGVYLMLAPLRVGHHRIHFTGVLPGFVLDITYDITVAPKSSDEHHDE